MGDRDWMVARGYGNPDGTLTDDFFDSCEEDDDDKHEIRREFRIDFFKDDIILGIYVDLTPTYYLNKVQKKLRREFEEKEYEGSFEIKCSHSNQKDLKALEVFYKNTFIGYIRKNYLQRGNTKDIIENFCFYENKLEPLILHYRKKSHFAYQDNGAFYLAKPNEIIVERMTSKIHNKESWMIALWNWSLKYRIPISFDVDKLKNTDYLDLTFDENNIENQLVNNGKIPQKPQSLPSEIGNLIKLDGLHIESCDITDLPEAVMKLPNLTSLTIAKNTSKINISKIFDIRSLKSLGIRESHLSLIPKEIANLSKLEELDFSNNKIGALPKEIGNLANLKELYIDNNKIVELPKEIGDLTALKRLCLNNNQLKSVPDEIGNLFNLEELYLGSNELTELPASMANLKALTTELKFYGNPVSPLMLKEKKISSSNVPASNSQEFSFWFWGIVIIGILSQLIK